MFAKFNLFSIACKQDKATIFKYAFGTDSIGGSSCTGSQEPLQRSKQYTTANQWLLNKESTMVTPLWTRTPGPNPIGCPALNYKLYIDYIGAGSRVKLYDNVKQFL